MGFSSSPSRRTYLAAFLAGIGAEIKGIHGVLPLLRWPFWVVWGICLLLPLTITAPERFARPNVLMYLFLGLLLLLGLAGVLSGRVALFLRRRKLVHYPSGTQVVSYLPQLITLLAFPPFLITMVVLFRLVGVCHPDAFPVEDTHTAWMVAFDNFLRCQLFFGFFDLMHTGFGPQPAGRLGSAVIFVSRLLMDLAFIKLAVQIFQAAAYRAAGLGRGEDKLFKVAGALAAGDTADTRILCQAVGDSLREAVEALRGELGDPEKGEQAWRSLYLMRDFALPYLQGRAERTESDTERAELTALIRRLRTATDADVVEPPVPVRWGLLALFGLALVLLVVLPFFFSTFPALIVAAIVMALLAWLIVRPRTWLDRLVRWRLLPALPPNRLALAAACWSFVLMPLLMITAAKVFFEAASVLPGVFEPTDEPINFLSAFAYVLKNLVRTDAFLGLARAGHLHVVSLQPSGTAGAILTLATRLSFDAGIIALLVTFGVVWFNRVFRRFPVSPNAELALRSEALECGPHAALLIGFHYRAIRDWLVGRMQEHKDERELFGALAASGFLGRLQSEYATSAAEATEDAAVRHVTAGQTLENQGRLEEAIAEYRRGVEIWARLAGAGGAEERSALGVALLELGDALHLAGQEDEAVRVLNQALGTFRPLADAHEPEARSHLSRAHTRLGNCQYRQGRTTEAVASYREAIRLLEEVIGAGEQDEDDEINLSIVEGSLGNALCDQGQFDEGIRAYRRIIDHCTRLTAEGRDLRTNVAAAHRNIAGVYQDLGRPAEALAEMSEVVRIWEELIREGREEMRERLASAWSDCGLMLRSLGRFDEAVDHGRRAIDLYEVLCREGGTDLRPQQTHARMRLAMTLRVANRIPEALNEFRLAEEVYARLVNQGRHELRRFLLELYSDYGECLFGTGRLAEARAVYRSALQVASSLPGITGGTASGDVGAPLLRKVVAIVYARLAVLLAHEGNAADGRQCWQQALAIQQDLLAQGQPNARVELARTRHWYSQELHKLGRLDEEVAELNAALVLWEELRRESVAEWQHWLGPLHHQLGEAHLRQGRLAEAMASFSRAASLFQADADAGSPVGWRNLAVAHSWMGNLLRRQGRLDEALHLLRQTLNEFEQAQRLAADVSNGPASTHLELAEVLLAQNQPGQAEPELRRTVALYQQLVDGGASNLLGSAAGARQRLGDVLAARGAAEEAAREHQAAQAIRERLAAASPTAALPAQAPEPPAPSVAPEALAKAREEVLGVVRQIETLAQQDVPPDVFFSTFLTALEKAIAPSAGAVWVQGPEGWRTVAALHLESVGLDATPERQAAHDSLLRRALVVQQPLGLAAGEPIVPGVVNPTGCYLLLSPLSANGRPVAVVELFRDQRPATAAVHGMLQYLGHLAGIAARYLSRRSDLPSVS
jgi:tetratricopeptide (TPR) repeat protein